MNDEAEIVGDDPLVDGMKVSDRFRRDFTVIDADRVLVAARRPYVELNVGETEEDTAIAVTSAADALFVILERHGLLSADVDRELAVRDADGLRPGGWAAQATANEPRPLLRGFNCFREDDLFTLPSIGTAPGEATS